MLPPFIVDLIKQLVTIVATALFTFLMGKFPNFPIPHDIFVSFLVWFVLTLLGVTLVVNYATNKILAKLNRKR